MCIAIGLPKDCSAGCSAIGFDGLRMTVVFVMWAISKVACSYSAMKQTTPLQRGCGISSG